VVTINRFDEYDLQREFRASVSAAARRFGEPTEYEGLVIVKEGFKNAEGHIRAGFSYYVHKSDKEIDDVIIHCTSDTMNLHNCMVDVKFFEGVAFEYDFFFSHLKNWQEIYQKSNALLHSFME
jgi:5-formaminoimidazole-4-carboxamide-1-beta-D-ribofuranosyl 5'-monophosphate synthetase